MENNVSLAKTIVSLKKELKMKNEELTYVKNKYDELKENQNNSLKTKIFDKFKI